MSLSRHLKYAKNVLTIGVTALALTLPADTSLAVEMSMADFRAKFQEKTGKAWENADLKEKRAFVREHLKTVSPRAGKGGTGTSVSRDDDKSSNLKRAVTVEVRKKFLAQYQKDWKDGTPEEQETFLQAYKEKKQEQAQQNEQKIQAEKDRLLQIQQQREAEMQAAEQKKLEEERLKEERARILEQQREAEKRKLAEQLEKLKSKQEEMKTKREQSRR